MSQKLIKKSQKNVSEKVIMNQNTNLHQKQEKQYEKKFFKFGNILFEVDQQYQLKGIIGQGVYGIVSAGFNKISNQSVAIKKIPQLFQNLGNTKRILRQIKILKFLKHKNIVTLLNIMSINSIKDYNEIYLSLQYMNFDLFRLIRSKIQITNQMIKFILFQILNGISFIHSAGIIHRDLKPENILINKKCELKIADMNLARKQTEENLTAYVASRPYRAPQIFVSSIAYTKSIDIWSIGCILAELLGRTVLFQSKDYPDQINKFIAYLGKPKPQMFSHIGHIEWQTLNKIIKGIPDRNKIDWKYLYPNADEKALDLLDHILVYDVNARFTAEECLNHPFLEEYKNIPRAKCEQNFDFSFDNLQLKEQVLRKTIFDEVQMFRKHQKQASEENQLQKQSLVGKKKIKQQ